MTFLCIKPQCSNHCSDCNCAISQGDDAATLVVALLNAFAVDGHGGPLEDGESELVDRARAWLAGRPQANADAEVGASWRANNSLEVWFPLTAERLNALEQWARDCRDQVLYPAAHCESDIGKAAEGFGQTLVAFSLGPNT